MSFVKLQSKEDFDNYRYAGRITAECLSMLREAVVNKTTKSLLELDEIAEEFFRSKNTLPVFKGYKGFSGVCCMSVNNQLVHTPPRDYKLQDGDIISFDTGCNFKGTISDSALTCIYGHPSKENTDLVQATQECLYAGIKSISKNGRVGAIGEAIFYTAKKKGYKVIERYTGHGISLNEVHSQPTILNRSESDQGVRFQSGMVIAIEPLLVPNNCSTDTYTGNDGWTVWSSGPSAHWEHSVLISEDNIEIITHRKDEEIDAIRSYI